jgi:3-hydroxybutyryl-CoA dehydrogenase
MTPAAPIVGIEIQTIGVIGAGQMGTGIAMVCAAAGFDVVLQDLSLELATAGKEKLSTDLDRLISKQAMTKDEASQSLARVTVSADLSALNACDLVIEAATEKEDTKRTIFQKLCPLLPARTLLATNTSSISITRLAATTDRPERFIGLHFMNPVPVMRLVEIIRGIGTEEAAFQAAEAFVAKLGKTAVVSEDYPAFIVNRVLLPMINEAVYALYEGVGSVTAIDDAMRLGANHPMGPLALADFIGLDTCLSIMQVLHAGLADSKYRPCPLLVKYVEAGWLGRKAKRGFYDYRSGSAVPTR